MAPPQLAADVPVADLRHPVLPDRVEALGHDPGLAAAGRLEGSRGERPGPDEPLRLEARLDDVVTALAAADQHLVGHRRDQVAS